jgi:hypothetical protein
MPGSTPRLSVKPPSILGATYLTDPTIGHTTGREGKCKGDSQRARKPHLAVRNTHPATDVIHSHTTQVTQTAHSLQRHWDEYLTHQETRVTLHPATPQDRDRAQCCRRPFLHNTDNTNAVVKQAACPARSCKHHIADA